MTPESITKQLELTLKDLQRCEKRCKRISKAVGIADNELIQYAVQQTQETLNYIKQLNEEKKDV